MLTIRLEQLAQLSKEIFKGQEGLLIVPLAGERPSVSKGSQGLVIRDSQRSSIGDGIFAGKIRVFLNEHFPDSLQVPSDELEETIAELTERAASYKLILETQVASFIVAAWIMGSDFDDKFQRVQDVLDDPDRPSDWKAAWLWQFVEAVTETLEDGPANS